MDIIDILEPEVYRHHVAQAMKVLRTWAETVVVAIIVNNNTLIHTVHVTAVNRVVPYQIQDHDNIHLEADL